MFAFCFVLFCVKLCCSVARIPFRTLILPQHRNQTSVASVCFVVSCILHNDHLTAVHFDHSPAACVSSDSWHSEGLVVPPAEVVAQDWPVVLEFLRKEHKVGARARAAAAVHCTPQLSSPPNPQLRHAASLVLRAAAACPVFDTRSSRSRFLQPPAQLVFAISLQRAFELASMQMCCRDNTQRAQLLCSCCPLSALAFRLPRAIIRQEGNRSFERSSMARIMRRCFAVLAWRIWTQVDSLRCPRTPLLRTAAGTDMSLTSRPPATPTGYQNRCCAIL